MYGVFVYTTKRPGIMKSNFSEKSNDLFKDFDEIFKDFDEVFKNFDEVFKDTNKPLEK